MIIILFTITAIAIIFVLAGLWLSFRGQSYTYERMPYAARGERGRRPVSVGRREYPGRHRLYGEGAYPRRTTFKVAESPWMRLSALLNVTSFWNRGRRVHETPWLGLGLVLLAFLVCGVYILNAVSPGAGLFFLNSLASASAAGQVSNTTASSNKVKLYGASKALVRISQVDPNSYSSQQEYNTWWPSACSAATITEVINSYGHTYKLSDILRVESGLGEITPELGLVEPTGIDKTVAKFNFSANHLNNPSLSDVINAANNGTPVIISFPPSRWAGGHILVLIGGDSKYVYLADSSRLNMRAMTRAVFMKYWAGFAVIVTPNS